MEKNTKSIISYFEAIERSLKMGDGLPADSPISPGHEYHLKLFSRFIAKSNSLATAIVDSCNELQTAILPFAHTLAEENVQEFVEAFAFYRSNHLTVVKITTYDANAFSVFRQQMNSFGRSLHELWGPFQEDVLEVKKRQDDLEQELSTLSKELEAIEPKISDSASLTPTTTSAASSTRSFFAAVASSWSRSDSKSRLYTELDSKIKDIIAQKQLLDLHPGYAEARVKLEAISTIQTSTVKIIDLLESIWVGAVTDCKTLRGQFDRISRARIPEVIRRELKSANTVYQLLADSLDAYAIGINEVEERLKKLV
ncbi:hypothetical protein FRC02_006864 [Tulasnella sp. 418]|nr:hypothetical protein FRC02_006864 [Tulasnella sp. 418]